MQTKVDRQEAEDTRYTTYQSPLASRYVSPEMEQIFTSQQRYSTWRKLWIALAESEQELGLQISDAQIKELKKHAESIDFERVATIEAETHHDVMAHVLAYGEQCSVAKPIIHLGATSCFVTDNADLLLMHEALRILETKIKKIIHNFSGFAERYKAVPCLGFTHFQAAQLTTVGKRACLWIQDFAMDLVDIVYRTKSLKFLGTKGATGTQASFLSLFGGDHSKVEELDRKIAEKMGFSELLTISGQTYTRKIDSQILYSLSGIGISAHKFATDLRLLASLKEIEEPFSKTQVGSSAMPYKRNPILAERICSLSRFLISLSENPAYTAATQWLERSLDDSANRRIVIPEAFLAADAIVELLLKLSSGLIVNEKVIEKHIQEELPFIATENILMEAVKKGGDRQSIHEIIRSHSIKAAEQVKQGLSNDLLRALKNDPKLKLDSKEIESILDSKKYIGRAKEQVEYFLNHELPVTLNERKKS